MEKDEKLKGRIGKMIISTFWNPGKNKQRPSGYR